MFACVVKCIHRLAAGIEAEPMKEADSLVEPQKGNEKNKQSLPVPLWT